MEQEDEIFSSPIQGIELSNKRANNGSPSEMTIQFCQTGSFKKIIEKENEDESENEHEADMKLYDNEGNAICQFRTFDETIDEVMPIIEDKENDVPSLNHLQTPLKNKQLRSPLKDITPSITKRRKKSGMQTISQKYTYLTPRTMAESRFSSSSGLRRIQRL